MTRIIDLKTIWAGPKGVMHPGKQTVAKRVAFGLCGSNQAEYADGLPPETAVGASAPQKAVAAPIETAVQGKAQVVAQKPPVAPPAAPVQSQVAQPVAQSEVKINLQAPAAWGAPK